MPGTTKGISFFQHVLGQHVQRINVPLPMASDFLKKGLSRFGIKITASPVGCHIGHFGRLHAILETYDVPYTRLFIPDLFPGPSTKKLLSSIAIIWTIGFHVLPWREKEKYNEQRNGWQGASITSLRQKIAKDCHPN